MLDKTLLIDLVTKPMPYGKYKGRLLYKVPEAYLVWMRQRETWPSGRLGILLRCLLEIQETGSYPVLQQLYREYAHR